MKLTIGAQAILDNANAVLRTIGYDINHIVDIAIAKRVTEAQARECDVSTEPDMTKIMQQAMDYIADEETTPEYEAIKEIRMRRGL